MLRRPRLRRRESKGSLKERRERGKLKNLKRKRLSIQVRTQKIGRTSKLLKPLLVTTILRSPTNIPSQRTKE